MGPDSSPTPTDREIVSVRVCSHSRERLFAAWTDPGALARWWGPRGFTNTFETFEPRPRGEWRFVMHGPDGTDYPNHSVFIEIVPPERIVLEHLSGPRFRVTATFEEEGDGTRLTFRMRFDTPKACARVRRIAVEANEQNFDRLEAELSRSDGS